MGKFTLEVIPLARPRKKKGGRRRRKGSKGSTTHCTTATVLTTLSWAGICRDPKENERPMIRRDVPITLSNEVERC
jgi:hypothetical protein